MKAKGKWWLDEQTRTLCIDVADDYEYWIAFDDLKREFWPSHIEMKPWTTPESLQEFERLRDEVLSR